MSYTQLPLSRKILFRFQNLPLYSTSGKISLVPSFERERIDLLFLLAIIS